MKVALPDGWRIWREDDMTVQVRCPSEIVGNMKRRGEFTIIGCKTDRQVVECLRVMLPARGIPYPPVPVEQLALL